MIARAIGWLTVSSSRIRRLCLTRYHTGRFAAVGNGLSIGDNLHCYAPHRIRLGRDISIAHNVTLRAMETYPWTSPPQTFEPSITIGDRCFVGNNTQLSAAGLIEIGADTLIAENCFIADNNHGYQDADQPVRAQPLTVGKIRIGAGCWIGSGCCIAGNLCIGNHAVIGANAVVTTDIPDLSLAVGAPARVIKRFDTDRQEWRRC